MENLGAVSNWAALHKGSEGQNMYTVSDIIADVSRGCTANNMLEDRFQYRVIFYIQENGTETRHYIDTPYSGLRKTLENIVRNHLSVTNSVVITEITALKNGRCIHLQSRTYSFSLDGYFKQISGENRNGNRYRSVAYGRYAGR